GDLSLLLRRRHVGPGPGADRGRRRVFRQGAAGGRRDLRAGAAGARLARVRQGPLFGAGRGGGVPLPETPEARGSRRAEALLTEAYGPVWGYLFGWTSGVVINPASIAAIAVAFATYLGFFVPLGPWEVKLVAVASIVALTALNCIGVKPGAITQNVLTLLKIG